MEELEVGCSPDGLVGEDGGIEGKCPNPATHPSYLELVDTPPSEYRWQVQGSMLVTGRPWWDFVSYHPDFPDELQLHVVRVKRDEEPRDLEYTREWRRRDRELHPGRYEQMNRERDI